MARWIRRMKVMLAPGGREALRLNDTLEGLLAVDEAGWLHRAARGRKTIVEIGSYRGKSAVLLAKGSSDVGGVITAIDPHSVGADNPRIDFDDEDYRVFRQQVEREGVADRVIPVLKTSADALPDWDGRPIDLLWVDGDHSYEATCLDLGEWGKFVRKGGLLGCHDVTRFPAVRRAWDDTIGNDPKWRFRGQVRSLFWAERIAD